MWEEQKILSDKGGWKAPLEDWVYTSLLSLLFTRIESINVGDGSVSLKIIGQVELSFFKTSKFLNCVGKVVKYAHLMVLLGL